MRFSALSVLLLAIPSFVSAAPIGSYTGLKDVFGRDYVVPTVVGKRDQVVTPVLPPHPSASPSGGTHYVSQARVAYAWSDNDC